MNETTTFTPGPWCTYRVGNGDWPIRSDDPTEYGDMVAKVPRSAYEARAEANARLIAQAPRMLDALQRLTHPMADDDDVEYALEVIDGAYAFARPQATEVWDGEEWETFS